MEAAPVEAGAREQLSGRQLHLVVGGLMLGTFISSLDTLIARRSVEPQRLLLKLEVQARLPGLVAGRLAADRRLGSQGQPYQLSDIWLEVGRVRFPPRSLATLYEAPCITPERIVTGTTAAPHPDRTG